MNPKYPVYIISKGRWKTRFTSKALERIFVPYRIVVEPQEYDAYASVISEQKILVLPFSNLGQGSIPARNWVWDHSLAEGHKRHWILDDNIRWFARWHKNECYRATSGTTFKAIEDFTDRYENIALSGMQYDKFVARWQKRNPFILNTRIYSCILVNNNVPHRWRGRYNEDTDLSLRVLKDSWCTVLFVAFTCEKVATMMVKGGNTEALYCLADKDGRWLMAESLRTQHPDVVRVVWKFRRWQHAVDYRPFKKNRLILRKDVVISEGPDNYGMVLKDGKG